MAKTKSDAAKASTTKKPVAKKTTDAAKAEKNEKQLADALKKEQTAFGKRFKAATKGKDLLSVAREINNDFEQYKTLQVINRVKLMTKGELLDYDMLEAIEKL